MRKLLVVPTLCLLASTVVVFAQATKPAAPMAAAATGKVDTQWKCTPPNPMNAVPVPDKADHAFIVDGVKCTAAKGEIGGVKEKDGAGTEFAEATGNTSKGHGIFVETLTNGDKITYDYTFTGVAANNVMQSGANKWTIAGGTGKFKGIKGSGACTAKGAADGTATFDCSGTYTMPAGK